MSPRIVGALLALFFTQASTAAETECLEAWGAQDSVATIVGHNGDSIQLTKGISLPPLTVVYNADVDFSTFHATLDGRDISTFFVMQNGRPNETVEIPDFRDGQLLRMSAVYKADYDNPEFSQCVSPPHHWRQWNLDEKPIEILHGSMISIGTPEKNGHILMEDSGGSARLKPVGEL